MRFSYFTSLGCCRNGPQAAAWVIRSGYDRKRSLFFRSISRRDDSAWGPGSQAIRFKNGAS